MKHILLANIFSWLIIGSANGQVIAQAEPVPVNKRIYPGGLVHPCETTIIPFGNAVVREERRLFHPFTGKKSVLRAAAITEPTGSEPVQFKAQKKQLVPKKTRLGNFRNVENIAFTLKQLDITCGIPGNSIRSITVDADKNTWVAYSGGIARLTSGYAYIYDAVSGFPDYPIVKVIHHKGATYIGTFGGGLVVLEGDSYSSYTTATGFISDLVLDFAVSGDALYIATYGKGILRLSANGSCSKITSPELNKNGNRIIQSLFAANGSVYLTLEGGYGILQQDKLTVMNAACGVPEDVFSIISVDKKGDIYLAAEKNMLLRISGNTLYNYDSLAVPGSSINAVFHAASGTTWLATAGSGLYTVSKRGYIRFAEKTPFVNDAMTCLAQDEFSNLWIGSQNNGIYLFIPSGFSAEAAGRSDILAIGTTEKNELIYEYPGGGLCFQSDEKTTHYIHPELHHISGIAYDNKQNTCWVSTSHGLYRVTGSRVEAIRIGSEGITNHQDVRLDKAGRVWVSDYNYGVYVLQDNRCFRFDEWTRGGNTLVFSTLPDSLGGVWAFADKGHFSYFRNDSITEYSVKMNDNPVRFTTGCFGAPGELFVGSNAGLYILRNGKLSRADLSAYIPNEKIQSLLYDEKTKQLWAGTPNGLLLIGNRAVRRYDENYGIVSGAFHSKASARTADGRFNWCTTRGILRYMPFEFEHRKSVRKITLESLEIPGYSGSWNTLREQKKVAFSSLYNGIPRDISLEPGINSIEFLFSAKNWGKEKLTVFKYRIRELQTGWTRLGSDGVLLLQHMPAGDFTLDVMAEMPDDVTSEMFTYRFAIGKPFYQQLWFLILIGVTVLGGIGIIINRYSQFSFDNFDTYGSQQLLISKTRVLAISNIVLLLGIDYFHSEITGRYIVNWPINTVVSLLTIGILIYTYYKRVNMKFLHQIIRYSYFFLCSLYIYRAYLNQFDPIISIEVAIAFLFSVFIFKDIKSTYIFSACILVIAAFLIYVSNGQTEHKTLFLSATIQALIAIIIFSLIESKKLSKAIFSDKLLNNSRQFIIVANAGGEIVYVNDFMAESLGYNPKEFLKNGWWNIRGWSAEEIEAFKKTLPARLSNSNTEKYSNTLYSPHDNTLHHIEWQDTPVEGNYLLGIGQDITESVFQQEELEKLSLVARSVSNGVVITDANSRIEWCNESYLRYVEYSLDEIKGKRPVELFSGKGTDETLKQQILHSEQQDDFEILQYTKSGIPKWFLINTTKIRNSAGEIVRFIEVVTDVTERKNLEEKYRYILHNAGDIIYTCNVDGYFDFINQSVTPILGFKPEELVGKHFTVLLDPEFIEPTVAFYANMFHSKTDNSYYEFKVVSKSGQTLWVSQTVNFIRDAGKTIIGFQAVVRDITLIKNLEQEKQLKQEQQQLFSKVITAFSVKPFEQYENRAGFLEQVCAETARSLGIQRTSIWMFEEGDLVCEHFYAELPAENLKGVRLRHNEYPAYFEAIRSVVMLSAADARNNPATAPFNSVYFEPNGIYSLLDVPIRSNGVLTGIICCEHTGCIKNWSETEEFFVSDIADLLSISFEAEKRRIAEEAIKESERNFRLINESISDVFWLYDYVNKKYVYMSPNSSALFELPPDVFYRNEHGPFIQVDPDDRVTYDTAASLLLHQDSYEIEYRITMPNGRVKWIHEKSAAVRNSEGKLILNSGACADVTERKTKEQLIENQNLDIVSSIKYAKRIQDALLPSNIILQSLPVQHALYYKPKDIIGGDFYWAEQIGNTLIIAVGDCTGHGVPGAIMTSLGINGLINCVTEQRQTDPAAILDYLDMYIKSILSNSETTETIDDGMDIGIVSLDLETRNLVFAGASRPLLYFRDGNLIKTDSTRRSIGSKFANNPFVNTKIDCSLPVTFYLYSDGMVDQFGGETVRRLGSKRFFELLQRHGSLPLNEQREALAQFYETHTGTNRQTDDMVWLAITF